MGGEREDFAKSKNAKAVGVVIAKKSFQTKSFLQLWLKSKSL